MLRYLMYAIGVIGIAALLVGTQLAASRGSVVASHPPPPPAFTPASTAPDAPINIVIDNLTSGETLAHLCQEVLVAEVTVDHLGTAHWNSPDGTRPSGMQKHDLLAQGYSIYTPVVFSGLHVLVDHRKQPTSEYTTSGGQVGQDRFTYEGSPWLTPQQRYILVFIPGLDAQATSYDMSWLIVYWQYRIDGDEVITQEAGTQEGGVTRPEQSMPLAQLERYLAAGCPASS